MRKNSKIITVLLSAVLAATLVLTVFIQAFASEIGEDDYGYGNVASGDEAEESIYPVSMEVVKAPESVTVLDRDITDSTFWSNVVVHIVYSNGEEYDVNCDGIDSEDGIVPPIAEIDGYKGGMIVYKDCISYNDDTVDFTVVYYYSVYDRISADFSVKRIDDPHSITRLEVTKLPDKVFTAPLFTGSREDIWNSFKSYEEFNKWMGSLDINNSIANHIDGMEVTCYYANGETITVAVNSSMMFGYGPYLATYNVHNVDEYGNYLSLTVMDEGDYKFSLSFDNHETIYTAKSASNPNPSINGEGTNDTPANPSDNKSSATSDVATNDVATNDNANNNNGTTNNGVVATGAVSIAVITLTVLVALTVAMYVWRKRNSGKA